MITFSVPQKLSNTKISNVVAKLYPQVPYATLQKLFRKKDVKVNNKRVSSDVYVLFGDKVEIYYNKTSDLDIAYEDDNIIIINKPAQIEVLKSSSGVSLLDLVQKYLNSSDVYPCHRLDRNTKGLVLFAKDGESLKILEEKIKNNEIKKIYRCTVVGNMPQKSDILTAYLFKDSKKKMVYINAMPKTGYQKVITKYTVLKTFGTSSLLEVEIVTGKTHQIRAHLAFTGHPIIGDGKYGSNQINKKFHKRFQELTAYSLTFNFTSDSGKLGYLNGKTVIKTSSKESSDN